MHPKKILFFINPVSGGINKEKLPAQIELFCQEKGIEFKIEPTSQDKKIDSGLALIKSFAPDAVVACGGDGTAHYVGKMVLNTNIPMGILPLGSANSLAKNLKIPLDIQKALHLIYYFSTRAIDTLNVNEHHCLHTCDLGFNANLIARTESSKSRGMTSYAVSFFKEIIHLHYFPYKVESTNEKITGKAFSITITNTRLYGSMAVINPSGKLSDGKFEICIIKPFPKIMLISVTLRLFMKTLHLSPYSIYIRTEKAVLFNEELESVHIDGELVKMDKKINLEVNPASLKVIIP